MPIPDLSNKPGPGRPGWSAGTYDFQFEVTGAVTIKAQPAATGTFTIKWPNGTEQTTTGSNSIPAPDNTAGVVSINKTTDTTYADEFAVVGGQTNVSKVLSWGANSWSNLNSCFKDCTSIDDISKTKLIAGTSCDQRLMFNGCTSLLEADIKSWDLTAGVNWDYGGPFHELGNLQKLDMTGMSIKLAVQARNFLGSSFGTGIGTNVANGCEFLMSNIDWSTSTATEWSSFLRRARFAPTSTFANWVWPQLNINLGGWTQDVRVAGTDTTIDMSGWTTYYDSEFPRIDFSTISNNDENLKVDFSNLNVSNINDMNIAFYYSDVSQILGIETWGATAGNVNMQNAFIGNNFLKFTNLNNFSDTFIQSLTPTTMQNAFFQVGWGLTSNYGVAPNISNIDLSNCTSLETLFWRTKFTNLPDIQSATFPSSAINMNSTFKEMRIYNSDVHFDLSNVSMKPSTMQQMFTSAWVRKVTFGNNVDFSDVTTVQSLHSFMNQNNPDGTTTELIYPTNADFSSLANTTDWFTGLNGTNANNFVPLSTCQVDNLIRRFRATAYSNALFVNFYESQITEAPSVVRAQQDELVANGWSFDDNTTDATLPFAYPAYSFDSEVTQSVTPTTVPAGAIFSSTDTGVTVNASTGVVSWDNTFMGTPTIRCTYADGCYNEVEMLMLVTVSNNYSMAFDGTGSYVNIPSDPLKDGATNFSFSTWVKKDASATGNHTILQSWQSPAWLLFRYASGNLHLYFGSTTIVISETLSSLGLDNNNWNHIAIVNEHDNSKVKIYVNGDLKYTKTQQKAYQSNTQPLQIGGGTYPNYWNGEIDEVGIFNRALTDSQVKLIYVATSTNKSIKLSSLPGGAPVVWYRMGD